MDVIFQPQEGGRPFSIEVGFFDTVLEIKEKIQKYQNIPIPRQTLVFNGQVLHDDRDVEYCEILHNSHIQLIIDPEPDKLKIKTEQYSPSKKINLHIRMPLRKTLVPLEMDVNETVLRLKEKIHNEIETIPVNRLVVVESSGAELQDYRCLRDCELMENGEIDVNIKPSPSASGAAGSNKKLKLMVLPQCGTKKIPVEVNASDNVGELRRELHKLHQIMHFHLPQEGYFFIYRQNVMDDDRSFRWHHVAQGDTIEIFNGSVTGGS
ncbi:ubiquitin domain-containing protein [Cephalotus follicularis]|uniref:Ubiquitin domain-containing protein n=1 Tax=Cephalotus follicularis TaxID=3775 RepID=A0A1Q3C062_CEPFO|nr:ubiquitin domain-containing protein [Cephalotus follicularis]